jgi:hypothetical protein
MSYIRQELAAGGLRALKGFGHAVEGLSQFPKLVPGPDGHAMS